MAVALDADQEALTFFSFPIEKQEDTASINPVDGTPDIWILGKATDGTIDGDREIVDPEWSAKALQQWADTGGNVRMAHDPKRPVGKGHEVHVTTDGHWVKSLISDPLAKHFIRTGVLNDYSVGISMPDFRYRDARLDPHGKASRIITGRADGLSRVAELSIVDRGSNFNSRFQIVRKSAGDGDELVGEMVGSEEEIAKAAPPGLVKGAAAGIEKQGFQAGYFPADDLSISFTPNDLARLVQAKYVEKHYDDLALKAVAEAERPVYKRDIDTATRRRLASEGKALPNLSYPIENAEDLGNAATLARSGHGDVAAARRLIARRAKDLGVANPLDDDDKVKKGSDEGAAPDVAAIKEADPDLTKDPGDAPDAEAPVKKAKKKPKGPKKLPPWLSKPADDDGKDGDDGKESSGACKSVTDHLWTGVEGTSDIVCSKCHTTPAAAAGVTASPMDPAPVGELMESTPPASAKGATPQSASGAADAPAMQPVPRHREPDGAEIEAFEKDSGLSDGDREAPTRLEAPTLKASPEVSALLRFRAVGIDPELGKLHDLTCPAFHPDEVQRFHPFSSIADLIDTGTWQRKSLEAACGPIERMLAMHELEQAAAALKAAGEADLNQWRLEAHKAFRDANPGPSTYPSPGMISPQKYNRPLITDGRAASSPGHSGPNTSPQVATMAPDAHSFDRPPLSDAHASPSPSFMKAGFPYPSQQGAPVQLVYARQVQDQQRQALTQMHDHLGAMFPAVCPMDPAGTSGQAPDTRHPVPATAGIGKAAATEARPAGPVRAALENLAAKKTGVTVLPPATKAAAPADDGMTVDADVYKGFRKQRKKLGKKVLAGKMTVDEARAQMGRRFAQKAAEPAAEQADPRWWQYRVGGMGSGLPAPLPEAVLVQGAVDAQKASTAELVKAAVREALHVETVPLEAATIEAFDIGPSVEAAVTKAVTPLLEKIQAQDTKLAEAQRVIDAIADQPDPSTASFSGLAFNPLHKSARPAGVTEIAEDAARARRNMIREFENIIDSAADPYSREAARASLRKYQGGGA